MCSRNSKKTLWWELVSKGDVAGVSEVEWEKVGGGERLCPGHHWVLPIMGLAHSKCSSFGRKWKKSATVLAATSRDGGHTEVQIWGYEHSPVCLFST